MAKKVTASDLQQALKNAAMVLENHIQEAPELDDLHQALRDLNNNLKLSSGSLEVGEIDEEAYVAAGWPPVIAKKCRPSA